MTDNEFATGGAHPALVTALSARGCVTPTPAAGKKAAAKKAAQKPAGK